MHGGQQLPRLLIPAKSSRALAARFVGVAASVQPTVALPAVRDDCGAWLDVIADESVQGCSRGVSQRRDPAPPVAAGLLDLHRDARQHLVAPAFATAYTRISTADVGLVDLHSADQALAPRAHEHGPQPVKHGPYGLVGTDLESALQTQRGDSVLAGGEEPAGGEPQGQGRTRAVEDRCGGDGASHTARGALETPIAQSPAVTPQASRTNEPGGPTQPLEVIQAVGIGSKPSLKLPERPWVVRPCAWMVHPASLPVSPVKWRALATPMPSAEGSNDTVLPYFENIPA